MIYVLVIGAIVLAAFMVGRSFNPEQRHYMNMTINGLMNIYDINESIQFSVNIEGYGLGCGTFIASLHKVGQPNFPGTKWYNFFDCSSKSEPRNFKLTFPTDGSTFSTKINQTGSYTLRVSFAEEAIDKEFKVVRR